MSQLDPMRDPLLAQARAGDQAALGQLLELYRNYLRLMARSLIHQPLQVRLDASDLVQETFLKAHREFRQFVGSEERELVAWLRQILVRTLSNEAKHHLAQGRDQRRQESLDVLLDRSSVAIQEQLADSIASPSSHAVGASRPSSWPMPWPGCLPTTARCSSCVTWNRSRSTRSPTRMDRSPNAVRKLWRRAMVVLKQAMEAQP